MPNNATIEPTIAEFRCKCIFEMIYVLSGCLALHSKFFIPSSNEPRSYNYYYFFHCFTFFSNQQLPVKIYESVIDIVQGEATMLFVNLIYTLATEEAERIGVDHVVRTSTHENGGKSAGKGKISISTQKSIF